MIREKELNIIDKISLYIKRSRKLYTLYSKLKKEDLYVNAETDICIEGYPRSGNTYLYKLIKELNLELKTANHKHSVGHIKQALYIGKPVVILVRNPLDAITSELIRYSRDGQNISKHLFAINHYIQFYDYVSEVSNQVTLVTFDKLTQNTEAVLEELNSKFQLWAVPEDYVYVAKLVLDKMKSKVNDENFYMNSAPTERRDIKKQKVNNCLKDLYPLELKQAYLVYHKLLEPDDRKDALFIKH
ncbi:MAG: hypothetical protein NWE89_04865 [Candidatus Bathyarchaeota archaeon]|nr:hypothetical protein [Candidatus Bathyarchaeota archaeon]